MKALPLLALLTLLACSMAPANVAPNPLFSENCLLQRGIAVPVWGTAADGEKVNVAIQDQNVSTKAAKGKWMVRLKPLKAGGPFTMMVWGSNTVKIRNILVGEVWLASGQSNMAMPLSNALTGKQDAASSSDPKLRLLTVPRVPSQVPVDAVPIRWTECKPEESSDFSAVAYYFGRELRRKLRCPIGLIDASRGGTRIEAWTPRDVVEPFLSQQDKDRAVHKEAWVNGPSHLYNGVIAPLIPFAMRGVIWYQGESNAWLALQYRELFPAMISAWRRNWGEGDFPFLFVQLAPFGKIVSQPEESRWAELREAQELTAESVPKTAMAVITDCGDPDNIHPARKEPAGVRLALAARAIAYGEKIAYRGPRYKSLQIVSGCAVVRFDRTEGGLVARGGKLAGFTIAGKDRKFHNASGVIDGDSIIVSSPDVSDPVAVRYGWAECPVANLFNKAGLPASPFRTDDFPTQVTSIEQEEQVTKGGAK